VLSAAVLVSTLVFTAGSAQAFAPMQHLPSGPATDALTLTADAIGWTLSITPEFAATYCAAGCSASTESFYVEGTEGPTETDRTVNPLPTSRVCAESSS
jgi:hypothetical protein